MTDPLPDSQPAPDSPPPSASPGLWSAVRDTWDYPPVRNTLIALGLVLLTLAAYSSVIFGGGFIWDDDILLTANPVIARPDGLAVFWWPFGDKDARAVTDYWPVTWTTLWLQWRLWGDHPTGYHVTNVLLHALSVVLLWRVLRALRLPGAVLAAAIFAVHPVCVASVAWISERKNTLSMVFYLLTLLAYVRFDADRRRPWYALALAAFLMALLCKTQIIMAPLVLLGLAWWRRNRITARDVLPVVPFLILSALFAAVTIYFQRVYAIGRMPLHHPGPLARLATAGMIPWFYLYKALLPIRLTMVYPYWHVDPTLPVVYLPGAALLAILLVCWIHRATWGRPLLAALGYFLIVLFPVLGFFDMSFHRMSLVADHLQYVAILGPIVLVAAVASSRVARLPRLPRLGARAAFLALVALLAVLTFLRGFTFRTARAMWTDVLAKNPSSPEAHYEMGLYLTDDGKFDQAIHAYEEAINLRPDYSEAHNNLGQLYLSRGDIVRGGFHCARALEIRPDNYHARINLAGAQYRIGATYDAARNFRRVLELFPDYAPVLNDLARILATDADPNLRNGPEAVTLALRACRVLPPDDPALPMCLDTLAMAYAEAGQFDKAQEIAQTALTLAQRAGDEPFAAGIAARLALYAQHKPFRILLTPPQVQSRPATTPATAAE